ncbi:MAG: RNA-binding protein [Myxococcales bacterium]|nr:RNA-binding protein [Myxococcales bacterium]
MSRKIFVGNLNFGTAEEALREFCAGAGTVVDVRIPLDRDSGRPRGFAFVTYSSEEEASAAIEQLNGQDLEGRALRIDTAEERRPPRPGPSFNDNGPSDYGDGGGGGGGGGRGRGYGGGGGGGGYGGGPPGGGNKPKGSRRGLRARKRSL